MAAALTPEQVDGWLAYDAAEPLGLRGVVAQLAEFLAMFAASKGVSDATRSQFMPGVKLEEREQTSEEQQAAAKRMQGVR